VTPLQILAAAVEGRPAPRIPVFCNLFDQGARALGMPQREYYASGENVAEGQLRMLARYGQDNVWSLFYVGAEAEMLGCRKILFADDGSPNVADFVVEDWDDVARLEIPRDITAHPSWERTAACLRILRREVGATHSICAYITASTMLPAMLMGMEKWMELLLSGPKDVRDELLRKCSDFCRQELAAYREGGANVLIYSTPFGSTELVGMKRFRELSLPWMRRDLEPGGTAGVVYYCGMSPFNNVIETVREKLGIGAYYVSPLADLAEAKALLGDRALTCGVINDIEMIRWTPEETRAEVRRLCAIGKPGGHFLLGTGAMPLAVPEANISAMLEAAWEYGGLT
jgi:uroporphyrinogen-III decarboxylase